MLDNSADRSPRGENGTRLCGDIAEGKAWTRALTGIVMDFLAALGKNFRAGAWPTTTLCDPRRTDGKEIEKTSRTARRSG